MRRQFDAACRQYAVKSVSGDGHAEWSDGLKSGFPSVKLLGRTEQAADPTPDAPQEVKVNNATVRNLGQNLFIRLEEETGNGVTLTHLADGGYLLNGTCTGSLNFQTSVQLPVGRYTLSCNYEGVLPDDSNARAQVYKQSGPSVWSVIENKAAANAVHQFTVSQTCAPLFRIRIEKGCTYDHVKLYPLLVKGEYTSDTMPAFTPYWDGGEVTAPPLLCAVNGFCQSTYDSQTGEFVNWWWDKITLNGSENWRVYPAYKGFFLSGTLPEKMYVNAHWSNMAAARGKEEYVVSEASPLSCGFGNTVLYYAYNPFYDETLSDKGLANWKACLAEHPLEIWVARNEPEITNIGPSPLTCPTGYGQIIQVAGDIENCPLKVKYLTHGGNVK